MIKKIRCLISLLALISPITFANAPLQKSQGALALGQVAPTTRSADPRANAHFTMGLKLLHNFAYDLAREQFISAQKIDPHFALAYWGEAMTYTQSLWHQESLSKARALMHKVDNMRLRSSAKEKDYLNAMRALYSDKPIAKRHRDYAKAMGQMHKTYPKDIDIASFYALSLMMSATDNPTFISSRKAIEKGRELINKLFATHSNHPGVVHYYIHLYDSEDKDVAAKALKAASKALEVLKDSSHVTHMASHTFRRLNQWDKFIKANQLSVAASTRMCQHLKGFDEGNNLSCNAKNKYHSLEWLHFGYLKTNDLNNATKALNQMKAVFDKTQSAKFAAWYYRMWARQIIAEKGQNEKAMHLMPLSQKTDVYWGAYSECGAHLANGIIALEVKDKTIYNQSIKRLNTLIRQTRALSDKYIMNTCRIHLAELRSLKALNQGHKDRAYHFLHLAKNIEAATQSQETSPSLNFLSTQEFQQAFLSRGDKKRDHI